MKCIQLILLSLVGFTYGLTGGRNAAPGAAPFIVSLQVYENNKYEHFCGGAIINKHWILTAAHCLLEREIKVLAGKHNITTEESSSQERRADFKKPHDLYVGAPDPHDIGLIYTKTPFEWTSRVRPILLPSKNSKPNGRAQLFGWGSISRNVSHDDDLVYPDLLQTADLRLITNAECKSYFDKINIEVHETNICTGSFGEGITVCKADSGGPLVHKNSAGEDELIGVVSGSDRPCGKAFAPSVYNRVSSAIDWIESVQDTYEKDTL